jgi:hypothetical protein
MIEHHIPEDMDSQQDCCGNLRLCKAFSELKDETDILLELVLQVFGVCYVLILKLF